MKNKKLLLLAVTATLSLTAGAIAMVSQFASQSSLTASGAIEGSILFSRSSGEFTYIDEYTSSTSGLTKQGYKIYAISHSNADVSSTGYIAQFGNGKGYDEQFIEFSVEKSSFSKFVFQAVTGVKVTTTASTDQTLYAYYGEEYKSSITITANSDPSVIPFSPNLTDFRIGTASVMGRNIVSVEVFYSCVPQGEGYSIDTEDGEGYSIEMISPTSGKAEAGDTVSFSVDVESGYMLQSVSVKKGLEAVDVSGPVAGVYSFTMPEGNVTISASVQAPVVLDHLAFGYGYKTQYYVGDSFQKPVVYAYYSDTSYQTVTDSCTFSGYNLSVAGNYTVTVSYTDGLTVQKTYDIVVRAASQQEITYYALDLVEYDFVDYADFIDLESSTLPTEVIAGQSQHFEIVAKGEHTYVGFDFMDDYPEITTQLAEYYDSDMECYVASSFDITIPSYDFEMLLLVY